MAVEVINNILRMEINLIILLQDKFFKFENFLGLLSTIFNPTFLYLYFIPIAAALNTKLYHRLIISCVASDYSNLILKWILSEDRPYYFVHESSAYTKLTRPTLYQTERTCETSPGSPSGHLMLASCFMYIIYDEINNQIEKHVSMQENKIKLKILNRFALVAILTLTAISRMYFATHFLHQTLLGAIIGTFISVLMTQRNVNEIIEGMSRKNWFLTGLGMALLTTSIYWLHKLISGNPLYSVMMAFKYCTDPLFPKPESTVIFSSVRSIALVFGIMFNAPIKRHVDLEKSRSYILTAVVLMLIQVLMITFTPKNYKVLVFYSYSFIVYAVFQFLFMYAVPKLCAQNSVQAKKEN